MSTNHTWQVGDLARIEATGKIVEIVTFPGHYGPGTTMIHTGEKVNAKVVQGLNRETRQIHLYLIDDLAPAV